ncbi:GNAT family N-acetyltransferase [Sphingomonas colocasiae]|uniref:N-acetyltransferase n=1 Tax=Sphingomonas colocasiae TaxID=1848973 RepID=A0ABS7PQ62_9SPHN|nr:GNAT family N-acetyltransferase [Sphingomonas colocasiae]MBY8823475.1 N-acetyltransferase [Sphingomonas colocasiae]
MRNETEVRNNIDATRYELQVDGGLGIARYERREGAIIFTHTEVPEALQGRGFAGRLIKGALADVRDQGLKVVPLCAFVSAYLDRHPEEQDLLATDAPG